MYPLTKKTKRGRGNKKNYGKESKRKKPLDDERRQSLKLRYLWRFSGESLYVCVNRLPSIPVFICTFIPFPSYQLYIMMTLKNKIEKIGIIACNLSKTIYHQIKERKKICDYFSFLWYLVVVIFIYNFSTAKILFQCTLIQKKHWRAFFLYVDAYWYLNHTSINLLDISTL